MDKKESLFRDVTLKMGFVLEKEQLEELKRVLSSELQKYIVYENDDRQLPSVNTGNNERLVQMFLAAKSIEGLSKNSIAAYYQTIRRFMAHSDIDLLEVDTNYFRGFFYYLEQIGNSSVTIDNNRRNLNSFYQWLVAEGYISHNPLMRIKRIKCEIKVKNPYSDIEITKFKDACRTPRERAVIDLLLTTGIRNAELCSITLSDVDFYDRSILINGKGCKQRVVYMSDGCMLHLQQYIEDREKKGVDSEYLICSDRKKLVDGAYTYGRITTGGLRNVIRKLSKRADVSNSYVHRFRRTFCCTMLDYTDLITVQTLMGHTSIETTRGYASYDKKKAKYEHSKLRMSS